MSINMKKIPPLQQGDLISVVSPASWLDPGILRNACTALESRGFRVKVSGQSFTQYGQFAGADKARAQAINNAFADKNTRAIFCARGGYGTTRILKYLDFNTIASNPKIFVGYSDVTVLLNYIANNFGFPTFHGPMLIDMHNSNADEHIDNLLNFLAGTETFVSKYSSSQEVVLKCGEVEAPIFGGNLTMIEGVAGTKYFGDLSNSIFFFEDTGEMLYKIDRMLNHLRLLECFHDLSGVIIGKMADLNEEKRLFGKTLREIYSEYFCDAHSNIPVIMDAPFGHANAKRVVPLGFPVRLKVAASEVSISLANKLFI